MKDLLAAAMLLAALALYHSAQASAERSSQEHEPPHLRNR